MNCHSEIGFDEISISNMTFLNHSASLAADVNAINLVHTNSLFNLEIEIEKKNYV